MKAPLPQSDLHGAAQAIRSGQLDAATWMRECLRIAQSPLCDSVFRSFNPQALQQAQQAASQLPLAGLAVSVKDLFDIQGEVTTSGGNILAGQAPADSDALAVARLKAAGGVVIGRTHMVELAFSGVGVNPHFGTPTNPQALWADPAHPRIPGGSSSGAAVSVATGAAFIGLGSDTGGSLRIPAALCGLVGFKPTARSVPTDGAIELSRSLDTVGAITRSVRDAILAHEILSGRKLPGSFKPLHACRFAVAKTLMQDGLDESVATHFQRSLAQISAAGAQIIELELAEIQDLGSIQSRGGFAAPELMAWMVPAQLWPQRKGEIDPRVAVRVAMADSMSAVDYIRLQRARQTWIASIQNRLQGIDAMLSPTVPIVAPPIADVAPGPERDAEFFRVNALLLRNTSVVNMLDGCAISLPNHRLGEMPTGLMLWHHGAMDDAILHISREIEALLR